MPMDYDCMKSILKRLSPSRRLELFERCPALRTADRKTPIKLDEIKFGCSFLQINDRKYQLGVVRIYENGTAPEWVRKENAEGGVRFDVGALAQPSNRIASKEMRIRNQRQQKNDRKPSIREMIENGEAEQKLKELLFESKKHDNCSSQEDLEWEIKELQKSIQSYNEQKAISELKFTNYLLLTKPTASHKHELLCYAFPIQQYLEYMIQFLLGGRTIHLDQFKYVAFKFRMWPENVTIRIQSDFEVEWKDNAIYTIGFPSKKIYFQVAYLSEFNVSEKVESTSFEVKEANLNETIGNLLEKFRDTLPEETRTQLIRKKLPVRTEYNTNTHKICIGVEKIRDGKMPSTRGDYRIEWEIKDRHVNPPNVQMNEHFNFLLPLLWPPQE